MSTGTSRTQRHLEMLRTAAEFVPAYVFIVACSYYSTVNLDRIIDALPQSIFGDLRQHMSCGTGVTHHDVILTFSVPLVVYWTAALLYFCLDWYVYVNEELPLWKHRFEKKTPHIVHHLYRRAIRMMLGIGLLINPLALAYLVMPFVRLRADIMCNVDNLIPSPSLDWPGFALKAVIVYVLTDVVFYTTHRICHEVPIMYQYIHKAHHAFVDSYAICASACHPVEQVFVNLSTVVIPCVVAGVPYHWLTVWLSIAVFNTVCSHSGYAWGGRPLVSSRTHDSHHKFQLCDYGTNVFMDRIFKTEFKDIIGKPKA